MFPIGCFISFVGIYILSKNTKLKSADSEDSEMEQMEQMVDGTKGDSPAISSRALSAGLDSPASIRSGSSDSDRVRTSIPFLGFLPASPAADRGGIIESINSIKERRRSNSHSDEPEASSQTNSGRSKPRVRRTV